MALPSGYTPLEYIESTGSQYVDTKLVINKTDSYEYILDALLTNDTFGGANGYLQFTGDISGGKRVTVRVSYDGSTHVTTVYVDGVVSSTTDWTSSYSGENVKIGILKMGNAGNVWYTSNPQIGKVYSCQIKKNGSLIRNFLPCTNPSGEVGLCDDVNSVFYGNAGTGTFAAGPVVPDAPAVNPSWFNALGVTMQAVVLTWSASEPGQRFRLYRNDALIYEGVGTYYTDSGLVPGLSYLYRVTGLNGSNESAGVTLDVQTKDFLQLITDRTAADVSAGRAKGRYNVLDLTRVGEAMAYLEKRFAAVGISVSVSPKLDWKLSDVPTYAQMLHYLADVGVLRDKLMEYRKAVSPPDSLSALTWAQANDIETILLGVEKLIQTIILSCRHYSGRAISGVNALP